jgi:hypothetical protein
MHGQILNVSINLYSTFCDQTREDPPPNDMIKYRNILPEFQSENSADLPFIRSMLFLWAFFLHYTFWLNSAYTSWSRCSTSYSKLEFIVDLQTSKLSEAEQSSRETVFTRAIAINLFEKGHTLQDGRTGYFTYCLQRTGYICIAFYYNS